MVRLDAQMQAAVVLDSACALALVTGPWFVPRHIMDSNFIELDELIAGSAVPYTAAHLDAFTELHALTVSHLMRLLGGDLCSCAVVQAILAQRARDSQQAETAAWIRALGALVASISATQSTLQGVWAPFTRLLPSVVTSVLMAKCCLMICIAYDLRNQTPSKI